MEKYKIKSMGMRQINATEKDWPGSPHSGTSPDISEPYLDVCMKGPMITLLMVYREYVMKLDLLDFICRVNIIKGNIY